MPACLKRASTLAHDLGQDRRAFVQVIKGDLKVNGRMLAAGDGARIENNDRIEFSAVTESEFLLFDMG